MPIDGDGDQRAVWLEAVLGHSGVRCGGTTILGSKGGGAETIEVSAAISNMGGGFGWGLQLPLRQQVRVLGLGWQDLIRLPTSLLDQWVCSWEFQQISYGFATCCSSGEGTDS